jgi:hypothetical protein
MIERPQLAIGPRTKGEPSIYRCSRPGQAFIPLDDPSPKEAMAELWAALNKHVREVHSEDRTIRNCLDAARGQAHTIHEASGLRELIRSCEKRR